MKPLTTENSWMKKSGRAIKASRARRTKRRRKEATLGPEWQACWRSMQRIIRQSVSDQDATQKDDPEGAAWMADWIAQSYFMALRKAVPDEPEKPVLYGIPLNISERILLSHVQRLNEMLCQLARAERWHACEELWAQADKLVRTFSELALKNPAPFKNKARKSLFMPSLRVPPKQVRSKRRRNRKWVDPYLGDSVNISQAIELSADAVGAKMSANRTRLGALCARLVGECVQEMKRARSLWMIYFTPYGRPVPWPTHKQIEPFRRKSFDELIAGIEPLPADEERSIAWHVRAFCLQSDCGVRRLNSLILPALTRETAEKWWKVAIEKMVEARFPGLLQQPSWHNELRAVSSGTQADMRKELKDYCRDKVKQFA
jgi:hypothetical protein